MTRCSVDDCPEPAYSRGWCRTHYQQWYTAQAEPCSVDGCGRPAHSRGWCTTHYGRWYKHGDPLHVEPSRPGRRGAVKSDSEKRATADQQRERARLRHQHRMATDPEYRRRTKERRERSRNKHAQRERQRHRDRMAAMTPTERADKQRRDRERYRRPEVRDHHRDYVREWSQRPGVAARRSELARDRRLRDSPAQRKYKSDYSRRLRDKLQQIPNPNDGQRFTPEADRTVMRDDIAVIEICYLLGRSYRAISNRRHKLRTSPPGPRKPRNTPTAEHAAIIRNMRTDGYVYSEIADVVNLSVASVCAIARAYVSCTMGW